MYHSSKFQVGNAHVIVIVLLIVAILGGLGYVVWKNHFATPPVENTVVEQPDVSENEKVELTEIAADKYLGTQFAIKYPKTWKMVHTNYATDADGNEVAPDQPNAQVLNDTFTITSPDGSLDVQFSNYIKDGYGVACENDRRKLVHIEREPITNYKAAQFAEYITHDVDASASSYPYKLFAGAIRSGPDIDGVTVDSNSACMLLFADMLQNPDDNPLTNDPWTQVTIKFKTLTDENGFDYRNDLTPEQMKAAMSGKEYDTAKEIVKSLYVKQ